jgi:hypothetical protein
LDERAIADRKLTQAKVETVKAAICADRQITPQELE